ncbi:MAG: hypothetical protein PHO14_01905 [Kiritimatiellae bacterium]|nr:hypothetical protein [Kiritimatiellia bacterium]
MSKGIGREPAAGGFELDLGPVVAAVELADDGAFGDGEKRGGGVERKGVSR